MNARALGRPCRPVPLVAATPGWPPPRRPFVTAGTYRSPERESKDHSAREARRVVAKAEAERKRAERDAMRREKYAMASLFRAAGVG